MRWIQSKTHNFGRNLLLLKNVQWCDFLATDTKLAPSRKKMLFPVNRWKSILLEQWIRSFTSFWIHFPAWGGGGFWQDPSREKRNMNAANSFWTNSSFLNQLISNYQRYLTVCIRKYKKNKALACIRWTKLLLQGFGGVLFSWVMRCVPY